MDKLQLFVLILALISTAQSEDDESPDFCDEIIRYTEFGETINITSPGHPAQYNRATSCILTLDLEISTSYVLGISQYIPTSAGCSVPYNLTNSDGNQLPNQYTNCSTSNDRTLYTNNVVIRTNSTFEVGVLLPAGSGDAFTFTFTVLPLLTTLPPDSKYKVDVMSTPAAYITSHQRFGEIEYGNCLRNQLTLENLADVSVLTLDFIYFNLGTLASCAGQPPDVLKVFGNEESDPLYDCGDTSNKPPQQILDTKSYNSLLFEFVTDDENRYNGFLLQYSVTTTHDTSDDTSDETMTKPSSTGSSVTAPSSNSASTATSTTQSTSMTSTTQPMTSTIQSTTSTSELMTSTTQPMTSTIQSTTSTSELMTSTTQPMTSTTQPMTSTTQPIASTTQPMTSTTQSMTSTTQPVTSITQPTTNNPSATTNTITANGTQSHATSPFPSESTPGGDHETSTNNISTTVTEPTLAANGGNSKILQVAIGAGIGIFLLIVVSVILGCILGRRYNDSMSSKKRANMNAYEESDQNDEDQTRPIPGRVGVDPFNQYSEVDLSCYAWSNLQERMAESVEPIPDPTNHYFTIEEPDGANSAGTGTPYTDSQVRYADNDQMPMSTFSGGATSPTEMEPNPYSDADKPEVSTNLRFPAKTRPDPANQYSDIDLSSVPANEMEDTNHYWEIERTNDGQTNSSSNPHQTAEVTRPSSGNVYHDVEPSISSEREFKVDEEPGTSTEEPATEGNERAPVYSMIRKNPVMVDNSLYEANINSEQQLLCHVGCL